MQNRRAHKQKGVTLVETLVALAVMGFVVAGLLALVGQNTRFAAAMEDRARASVIADNLMVEAMVLFSATEKGELSGEVEHAGQRWRYKRVVAETTVENVVRIDLEISLSDSEQVLAHVTSLRAVQ